MAQEWEPLRPAGRAASRPRAWRPSLAFYGVATSLLMMLPAGGPTMAQQIGKRVFGSRTACENSDFLSREECRHAFENAAGEIAEKAPKFSQRAECERFFRRCAIAGFGGSKNVTFEPAMRAVEVEARSPTNKTARPILEGANPAVTLQTRSVLRQDSWPSPSAQKQAQAQWRQAQDALAKDVLAKDATRLDAGADDKFLAAPAPADPVDPAKALRQQQFDLESKARRREEIRRAPYIP